MTGASLEGCGFREDPLSVRLGPVAGLVFPDGHPLPPLHVPLPAVTAPAALGADTLTAARSAAAAEAGGAAHAYTAAVEPEVRSKGDDAAVGDGGRIALLSAVRQVEVSCSRRSDFISTAAIGN